MLTYPLDKSKWPEGPWQHETDLDAWDLPNGLHALIRRNPLGAWCGYVGVPPDHPWFGRGYNTMVQATPELLERNVDTKEVCVISMFVAALRDDNLQDGIPLNLAVRVHGGLTFADTIPPSHMGKEGWWYFGFDCSHSGDFSPSMLEHMSPRFWDIVGRHEIYRNESYVRMETAHLSEELLTIPPPCVELDLTCQENAKKPHRPLRPSRTASPKPTSIKRPIWNSPSQRRAASQRKRKSQKTFAALIGATIAVMSTSS